MPGQSSPSRSPRRAEEDVAVLARTVDDLNNRLQLILMAHREQGNISSHAGRAREETLAALEAQVEETRNAYSRQLEDVIKARDNERQGKLILESQNSDLRRKLEALKKSFESESSKVDGLEDALAKAQQDAADKNALVLQLKSSNENLLMQVGNLKKKLQSLESQLAEALKGADQNVDELNFWKARAQSAEQTYETLQADHLSSINKMEREIVLLRGSGEGLETRLRSEFAKQMSEIVRERQLIYENEKNQLLEDQRLMYEQKIRSLRSNFNERSDEVNAIIARSQELETINKVLSEKADEDAETIKALQATVDHQKTLLEELKNKPMLMMTKKDHEIRELRNELEEKDRVMRELEEARIRLDKEIQTYRVLLLEEENRLQAQPTSLYAGGADEPLGNRKKRKLAPEVTTVRISETATTTRTHAASRFGASPRRAPLRLGYEFRGNRFSLVNQSGGDYDLNGWKIGSLDADFEHDLPQQVLGEGEQITFWWGAAMSGNHDPPSNVFLEGLVVPVSGARIQLVNPEGSVVDGIVLRRTVHVRRSSENCMIM